MSRYPLCGALVVVAQLPPPTFAHAKTCDVKTEPIAFGAYDPDSPAHLDLVGSVSLKCKTGVAFTLIVDWGTHGVPPHSRRMKHEASSSYLAYNFFVDSARSLVWADGSNDTGILAGVGQQHPKWVRYPVYARVYAHQYNLVAGAYVDTVTATVLW